MTTPTNVPTPLNNDPRHTFLTPREVFTRFRWGKTKGYEVLKQVGFPLPIGGAYRLDLLMAWEDRVLTGAENGSPSNDAALLGEGLQVSSGASSITSSNSLDDESSCDTDELGLPVRGASRRRKSVA